MATPAITLFDSNNPNGAQLGPSAIISTYNNLIANRNSLMSGKVAGYVFERAAGTGSADNPQFFYFKNTTTLTWFRATNTWAGNGAITSTTWDWSNDAGATWAAMHAADAVAYDANYNITAANTGSSFIVIALEALAKVRNAIVNLAAHIAGTGTGVHGLGGMATQVPGAVAITGGAIDGTNIGVTVRALANFTRTTEALNTYAPAAGAGQALDWANGASKLTTTGVNVVSFANVGATGIASHVLDTANLVNTTFPAVVVWGAGGKPVVAGRALVALVTNDAGATVFAALMWRAV